MLVYLQAGSRAGGIKDDNGVMQEWEGHPLTFRIEIKPKYLSVAKQAALTLKHLEIYFNNPNHMTNDITRSYITFWLVYLYKINQPKPLKTSVNNLIEVALKIIQKKKKSH